MNIAAALRSLPRNERRVMTLDKVYGYTSIEIAVRLHMDLSMVNALLARAAVGYADALERR